MKLAAQRIEPALGLRRFARILQRCAMLFVAAAVLVVPGAASAASPEQSCQDTVASSGLKYFAAAFKALSQCEQSRSDGSIPLVTNCRPSVGPVGDMPTAAALAKAGGKLSSAINKKCGTVTVGDLTFGKPCESVADVNALIACVRDDAQGANAENLIETIFDDTGSLAMNTASLACQSTVSGAAGKYAQTRSKARLKCAKSVMSGKTEGPCPDAKAHAAFDKALAKFHDTVLKKCDAIAVNGLDLGFPCDLYVDSTFDRVGTGNVNGVPRNNRFERCLAAATAGTGDLGAQTGYPLPDDEPFSLGVAAGDETDVAFVAWTRTTNAVDPVTLEVATDSAFATIVDTQTLAADAAADNTVHGEVTGLTASTQYYYRFKQAGGTSRVGRLKTAPAAASTAPFTFGFTGDANAFFKPFAVLEQITKANPDVWLFIGDTIYGDDARSGTGQAVVRSDYHGKYRENRDDHATRDLMASVGMYTMWDDHEVTNDFWGTDPAIQTQMTAGNQAFRDYMPVRVDGGDPMRLYRSFRWGTVAEFFLIDDRQYRSAQADVTELACVTGKCSVTNDDCGQQSDCDAFQLGQLCHKGTCVTHDFCATDADCALGQFCGGDGTCATNNLCSTQGDCDAIQLGWSCKQNQGMTLPNATCQAEIANPARTYLGATQLAWLKNGLQTSPAKFKFVMNGPLLSAILFVPYDRWEGYAAERQDLLNYITTNNIKNVVFLSTDIHGAIVNDNVSNSGVRELVAGAVGMDPIRREVPASVSAQIAALPILFPTVKYFDLDRFNVTTATVSLTQLDISWRDGSGQLLKQLTIPAQ